MKPHGMKARGMKTRGLRPARKKEKAPGLVQDEAGGPCEEDRRRAALPRSWA